MADEESQTGPRTECVILKVHEAMQSDVTLARIRVDTGARKRLGIEVGEVLELRGKRATTARVVRAMAEDEGKGIVRIDGLTRKNAQVEIGGDLELRRVEARPAKSVVLAPVIENDYKPRFGHGTEAFVRRGLLKRPLVQGDALVIPGIALMSGYLPFTAVFTEPAGVVLIDEDTEIVIRERPFSENELLPGVLRDAAQVGEVVNNSRRAAREIASVYRSLAKLEKDGVRLLGAADLLNRAVDLMREGQFERAWKLAREALKAVQKAGRRGTSRGEVDSAPAPSLPRKT